MVVANAIIGIFLSLIIVVITGLIEFYSTLIYKEVRKLLTPIQRVFVVCGFIVLVIIQVLSFMSIIFHTLDFGR